MSVSKSDTENSKRTKAAYQIPVVVHIIHNGLGDETNIPDAQVLSQIRVLNEDFNRLNADAANTPSAFLDAAGSLDVEFILAKRTPDGLPTNGINRVQGSKTLWRVADNYTLKSLSYWPAEDYLNIWVCNLDRYLGYAQFPQSTLVDGLENSSTNRLTDGVVIAYDAFGSIDDGDFEVDPKYSRGRTATHEVGHYLGLRHISGDDEGDCGAPGDYVDDTPDQASQNYNCPSHPLLSCSQESMFQNYLDYTNDVCMNLFTKGQATRMKTILDNSPRRKSLNLSEGATDPEPMANDLGIQSIVSPRAGECAEQVIPLLKVRNYGTNLITSCQVRLLQDGAPIEIVDASLDLDVDESADISFGSVSIAEGATTFTFEILETNGGTDNNPTNNTASRPVITPQTIATPIVESFNELPDQWLADNPDGLFSWEIADAPLAGSGNKALLLNFFDYEDNQGEVDVLATPLVDLADVPLGLLLFDVAHARYRSSNDGLRVILLDDCNPNLNQGTVLYEKLGAALATTVDSNNAFVPTSSTEWRTEIIDLTPYIGQKVQLAFIGINDYGNNLYLDNVRVLTSPFVNLTLMNVISPSPVACDESLQPQLLVKNSGTAVSGFSVSYTVNGVTNLFPVETEIAAGAEVQITLPLVELEIGTNDLLFTLEDPDGMEDVDPSDNSGTVTSSVASTKENVPFRQQFENDFETTWLLLSPNNGLSWEKVTVEDGTAVYHEGYSNAVTGSEAWLVTPGMDLSELEVANLYFDVSYALRAGVSDILQVRASTGCDSPFDIVLQTYSDEELSEISRNTPWKPASKDDWTRKRINLEPVLGQQHVRFAFVVVNNKGNNLYLDNIELFPSDHFNRVDVEGVFNVYPNPSEVAETASIAFSLPELQDVTIQVIDNVGRTLYSQSYEKVLNQIYQLPVEDYQNGLYHVRVITARRAYTSKLVLAR